MHAHEPRVVAEPRPHGVTHAATAARAERLGRRRTNVRLGISRERDQLVTRDLGTAGQQRRAPEPDCRIRIREELHEPRSDRR